MQADIIVQAPSVTQSYNRYSYVTKNPLAGVDPSGYSIESFLALFANRPKPQFADGPLGDALVDVGNGNSNPGFFAGGSSGGSHTQFITGYEDGGINPDSLAENIQFGVERGIYSPDSLAFQNWLAETNPPSGSASGAFASISFQISGDGPAKVQKAVERFALDELFKDILPAGKYEIEIQFVDSLPNTKYEKNPLATVRQDSTIIIFSKQALVGVPVSWIGSSIAHELKHINDELRGSLDRTSPVSVIESELSAYRWEWTQRNYFNVDPTYKSMLQRQIRRYSELLLDAQGFD